MRRLSGKENEVEWILFYIVLVNLGGFCLMGMDKRRAKRHEWRVPETRLFLVALLGGSIGSIVGMRVFRHKTKHWYFVWGMPAILVLQIVMAVAVLHKMW